MNGPPAAFLLAFLLEASSAASQNAQVYLGFLGDGGTGGKEQKAVARRLEIARERGTLDYIFLLGDNLYDDGQAGHDYREEAS